MSVSLFDYEILQKENAALKAEVERLKDVCRNLNREKQQFFEQGCINKNEADKLQLLVKSYRAMLLKVERHHQGKHGIGEEIRKVLEEK